MSFCADSGFACFGLVDQNYELPPDVLEYIGVDVIRLKQKDIAQCEIPRIKIEQINLESVSYNTIDVMVLRRGVVGVNKIAYTL